MSLLVEQSIYCNLFQVHYLSAIDGKDVADTTRRILRSIMTNAVASRMNFTGHSSKTDICQMKILDVVIGKKIFKLHLIRDGD